MKERSIVIRGACDPVRAEMRFVADTSQPGARIRVTPVDPIGVGYVTGEDGSPDSVGNKVVVHVLSNPRVALCRGHGFGRTAEVRAVGVGDVIGYVEVTAHIYCALSRHCSLDDHVARHPCSASYDDRVAGSTHT